MTDLSQTAPKAGDVIQIIYPFVRDIYEPDKYNPDGPKLDSWKPGVRHEFRHPDYMQAVADAEGHQIFNMVDVYKPGRFPTRVFYTRLWRDPEGKVFGLKGKLRIATMTRFKKLAEGYYDDYEVSDAKHHSLGLNSPD